LNPFVFLPADWAYLTQPDPSILSSPSIDTLSNMAYGTLTAGQQATLAAQALPGYTQAAAGDPELLAATIQEAQAEQTALTNISGGTAPSIANVTAPSASDILGIPWWVWLAIGIPGALLLFSAVRK